MTKNLLVLGCGYVGSALLRHLNSKGLFRIATTTSKEKVAELAPLADKVCLLNASDKQALKEVLENADMIVVAIAAKNSNSYRSAYLDTAKTISSLLPNISRPQHFIYLSSTSVYGDQQGRWVTELSPLLPNTPNGQLLKETEEVYLQELPPRLNTTVLRLAGIYGPGRDPKKRAERLAGAVFEGDKDAFCNWVHVDDIVGSIAWTFEKKLQGIYNVCSSFHPTREKFYGEILEELALPPIQWKAAPSNTHTGNKRVSSDKLIKTGFHFKHSSISFDTKRQSS